LRATPLSLFLRIATPPKTRRNENMAIRIVSDVGAPVAVVAVDLITEATAPTWNEWVAYIMTAGGYLGAVMGWGGDFSKNIGIASLPWAAKKLYDRVKGPVGTSRRLTYRQASVSRYPAPATKSPYEGVKLV